MFAAKAFGGLGLPDGVSIAGQLATQASGVIAVAVWCGVCTWVLLRLIDAVVGLRVSADKETEGLDLAEHGERGYIL